MRAKNLDITLDLQVRLPEDIDINSVLSSTKIAINDITISLGEEVNIDDPRFTEENASIGLWMPHHFLKKIGAGIYFLDPFDPNKIPVLFVHGVSGNPNQ